MRNATRSLSVALVAIGLVSCSDAWRGTGPRSAGLATFALAPRFSEAAGRASAALVQAGVVYDRVRIVIVRPQTDTLKDTTITFQPGDPPRTLELAVLAVPNESLIATVRFQQGATVLFEGTANVVAIALTTQGNAANTVDIEVTYTGPGATATRVSVSPGSGVYPSGTTTQFTAEAFDVGNNKLTDTPFAWSTSDTNVATVSSTGVVTPKGSRGTVRVRAFAANGKADSATVVFAPVATRLRVVQGAAQTGAPGTQLSLPVIIEVVAADGLPAPGAGLTATFTAINGGSITPSSVVFDANGRVQALVTLGSAAGGVFLYTVTAGTLSPLTFVEIAVVGPPTQLIPSGSTTFTMTAGVIPEPVPTLRVADAAGNSVTGVPLKITIQKGATTVFEPFVIPSDTIGLLAIYAVAPTVAGTYTVTVESANALVPLTPLVYTITIVPGAAAKVAFIQQPTNVTANAIMSPAVTVAVKDQYGNTVTSASNLITLSLDPATGSGVTTSGSTLSVNAVNGVATFSNLTFSPAKTGVRLVAGATGFSNALSTAFNIQ